MGTKMTRVLVLRLDLFMLVIWDTKQLNAGSELIGERKLIRNKSGSQSMCFSAQSE
jgi:hypothetical protein